MDNQLTSRSLERRLKKYVLKENFDFFASCTIGFESVLEKELSSIPELEIKKMTTGGIEFSGPIDLIYFANVSVRVANRILIRITTLTIKSLPELFNKMKRVKWEVFLGQNPQFCFDITAKNSRLHHTGNIASTMRDGITDYYQQFKEKVQIQEKGDVCIFVRFFDDECTISLDTSGEHLHKRGYKSFSVDAPIRETIASGLLQLTRLKERPVILDPFCGSGTFLFELALILQQERPGIFRSFAFEKLPFYNEPRYRKIKNVLSSSSISADFDTKWLGFDINPKAIDASESNKKYSPIFSPVMFSVSDFFELKNSFEDKGLIISNLPYGKRIDSHEMTLSDLYRHIGKQFKKEFLGWDFLLVIPDNHLEKYLDLSVKRQMTFSNGGISVKAIWGVC